MVLCFLLCLIFKTVEIAIYGLGIIKTLKLLSELNKPQDDPQSTQQPTT